MSNTISLFAILLLLGTACSEDPVSREEEAENPLLGHWRLANYAVTINDTLFYDLPGPAEPVYMQIVEFQTDIFVVATNILADGTYDTLALSYDLLPDNKVNIDGDFLAYFITGTELTLSISDTLEDATITSTVLEYTAYTGEFPPQAWLSALPNDSYEPDDSRDSATLITVGAVAQSHILVAGDEDWFSFAADSGANYLIDTSQEPATVIISTYMELYDAISTAPIDSIFGNISAETIFELFYAALSFSPTQTGVYYVKISNLLDLGELATGPYRIAITEVPASSSPVVGLPKSPTSRLLGRVRFTGFWERHKMGW